MLQIQTLPLYLDEEKEPQRCTPNSRGNSFNPHNSKNKYEKIFLHSYSYTFNPINETVASSPECRLKLSPKNYTKC